MNILNELESGHSKQITNKIIHYVGRDKTRFEELMAIFLSDDKKLQQRAAWPLSFLAEGNPRLIEPYLKKLIKLLDKKGIHQAVARNIMRIFQQYDMPEKYHGVLIDKCFQFILSPTTAIAIRAFSITTATHLSLPYPELRKELGLVLNEHNQYEQTPAIQVRVKKALKSLRAGV